jgi:hypothetical protein
MAKNLFISVLHKFPTGIITPFTLLPRFTYVLSDVISSTSTQRECIPFSFQEQFCKTTINCTFILQWVGSSPMAVSQKAA